MHSSSIAPYFVNDISFSDSSEKTKEDLQEPADVVRVAGRSSC